MALEDSVFSYICVGKYSEEDEITILMKGDFYLDKIVSDKDTKGISYDEAIEMFTKIIEIDCMETRDIIHNDKILARYIPATEAWGSSDLSFFSQDGRIYTSRFPNYTKVKKNYLPTHSTKSRDQVLFTQEVIYVKSGSLQAYIYDDNSILCRRNNGLRR